MTSNFNAVASCAVAVAVAEEKGEEEEDEKDDNDDDEEIEVDCNLTTTPTPLLSGSIIYLLRNMREGQGALDFNKTIFIFPIILFSLYYTRLPEFLFQRLFDFQIIMINSIDIISLQILRYIQYDIKLIYRSESDYII